MLAWGAEIGSPDKTRKNTGRGFSHHRECRVIGAIPDGTMPVL